MARSPTTRDNSVIAWLRRGAEPAGLVVVVSNFTPVPRDRLPHRRALPGFYREALNTDAGLYGGSNMGNAGGVEADADRQPWAGAVAGPDPAAARDAHPGAEGVSPADQELLQLSHTLASVRSFPQPP